MEHQLAHIDVDVFGNVGRQALHLDFPRDEVEQTTLLLDTRSLALHEDRHRDHDLLVHRELIEVSMQQLMRDRVELVVANHDTRLATIELQVDQRVGARFRVENAEHLLRVDGDGHSLRRLTILAGSVDDGRNPAGDAKAPRFVLASAVTLLCIESCVHSPPAGRKDPPSNYTNSEETEVSS